MSDSQKICKLEESRCHRNVHCEYIHLKVWEQGGLVHTAVRKRWSGKGPKEPSGVMKSGHTEEWDSHIHVQSVSVHGAHAEVRGQLRDSVLFLHNVGVWGSNSGPLGGGNCVTFGALLQALSCALYCVFSVPELKSYHQSSWHIPESGSYSLCLLPGTVG